MRVQHSGDLLEHDIRPRDVLNQIEHQDEIEFLLAAKILDATTVEIMSVGQRCWFGSSIDIDYMCGRYAQVEAPQYRQQPPGPTADIKNVDSTARYIPQDTAEHPAVEPFLDTSDYVRGGALLEGIVVGGIDKFELVGQHRHDRRNIRITRNEKTGTHAWW